MNEQPKGTILSGYYIIDLSNKKGMLYSRFLVEELELKTGQLFGALRTATTGLTAAPPLFQTMVVLGRDTCLKRIEAALAKLNN
ncbi:hypothetical protein ACFLYN_04515 [Chloroflexota bacterium]